MSYFSSKSTWLSLVDSGRPARDPGSIRLDGLRSPGPDGFALPDPDFVAVPAAPDGNREGAGRALPLADEGLLAAPESAEDLDHLRITIDLRHKLFFHFREWEFGPALLEDHLRMARAQTPYVFQRERLLAAHASLPPEGDYPDVAQLALAAGLPLRIIPGSPDNLRVTSAAELAVAAALLAARSS